MDVYVSNLCLRFAARICRCQRHFQKGSAHHKAGTKATPN